MLNIRNKHQGFICLFVALILWRTYISRIEMLLTFRCDLGSIVFGSFALVYRLTRRYEFIRNKFESVRVTEDNPIMLSLFGRYFRIRQYYSNPVCRLTSFYPLVQIKSTASLLRSTSHMIFSLRVQPKLFLRICQFGAHTATSNTT
ncbi:hypothetical protein F5Y11DRAFT_98121 [Daldinia sp. FL1419]|nr:hypothetical protein F5Y11DRAFT_98121 [Daldinia sp. FL1419]